MIKWNIQFQDNIPYVFNRLDHRTFIGQKFDRN